MGAKKSSTSYILMFITTIKLKNLEELGTVLLGIFNNWIFSYSPPTGIFQWFWVVSNIVSIISFTFFVTNNTIWYTLFSISSVLTYSIITYRHIQCLMSQVISRQNNISSKPFSTILKSENTHFLIMTILLCISQKNWLKGISLCIYSFVSVVTFFIVELYPDNGLSAALFPLYNYFESSLIVGACASDLLVTFIYMKELIFESASPFIFVTYCLVFAVRLENSGSCQYSLNVLLRSLVRFLQPYQRTFFLVRALTKLIDLDVDQNETAPVEDTDTVTLSMSTLFTQNRNETACAKRISSSVFDAFSVINDLEVRG